MDADFSEKLKNVLSNPDAMAKIMSIASNLGTQPASQDGENASVEAVPVEPRQSAMHTPLQIPELPSDPRISLIYSLKPLVREEKRERLDAIARALSVASIFKNIRK